MRKERPAARPDRPHPGRGREGRRAAPRRRCVGDRDGAVEEHRRHDTGRRRAHRGLRIYRHQRRPRPAASSRSPRSSERSPSPSRSLTRLPMRRRRRARPCQAAPPRIVESLTPDALVATPIPPDPTAKRADPRPLPAVPTPGTAAETGPLRRFYYALPFSPRGRPGPPSMIAELRLTTCRRRPTGVKATFVADSVRLEWEPSGGLIGFLLERSLAPELSPLDTPLPEPASSSVTASACRVRRATTCFARLRRRKRPRPNPQRRILPTRVRRLRSIPRRSTR